MSNYIVLFFLLLSISSTFCQNQDQNNTQETNVNYTNNTFTDTSDDSEFNMTIDEMDTIMICASIVHEILPIKEKDIDEQTRKMGYNNSDPLYEKVGCEIFQNCVYNIDIKIVNKFMKNLTYFNNLKWEKSFDEFINVNLSKFTSIRDTRISFGQRLLMYKYAEVKRKYYKKMEIENERINTENNMTQNQQSQTTTQTQTEAQKDMGKKTSITKGLVCNKCGIYLAGLFVFFGLIFLLLKILKKKPEVIEIKEKKDKGKGKEKEKEKKKKKKVE